MRVFTFAPSAVASRGVLRGEGFANADTVARLLVDKDLQREVQGNVLWIDEAGLGWLDDICYIFFALSSAKGAMGERRKRAYMDELELQDLAEKAQAVRLHPGSDDVDEDVDDAQAA